MHTVADEPVRPQAALPRSSAAHSPEGCSRRLPADIYDFHSLALHTVRASAFLGSHASGLTPMASVGFPV